MNMAYTREQVIKMCKEVHGDKYDYSITEGVQNKLGKIKYICPIHGVREQMFHNHLQGKECSECAKKKCGAYHRFTNENFFEKAKKKHNLEDYDWTNFDVDNRDEKGRVEFCCKKHGKYLDWPSNFIKGYGCHVCYGKSKDDDDVREELSRLHPELDFSKTKYSEHDEKYRIRVMCPKHGEQLINYYNLINGQGCYYCGRETIAFKNTITNEELIRRGKEIFGEEYTYEHLDMYNRDENGKITITCPKHGDFKILPTNFFRGVGCPVCAESSLEGEMRRFLEDNNVEFVPYKKFDWLGKQHLDFYLPEYNVAIECQGGQHFKPVDVFGGDDGFAKTVALDMKKKKLCKENGVKIFYYANERYNFPYKVFMKKERLLEEVKRLSQN
jgi:hypothetical protein